MYRHQIQTGQVYAYSRVGDMGRWADLACFPVRVEDAAAVVPGARHPLTGKPVTYIAGVVLDRDTLTPAPNPAKGYTPQAMPGRTLDVDPSLCRRPWAAHLERLATLEAEQTEVNRRLEAAKVVLRQRRAQVAALLDPADHGLLDWLTSAEPEAISDSPADVRLRYDVPLATLEALLRSARRAGRGPTQVPSKG